MKIKQYFSFLLLGAVLACAPTKEEPALEKLPYFDLKGFINLEISKIEGDSVLKTSEITEKSRRKSYCIPPKIGKKNLLLFIKQTSMFLRLLPLIIHELPQTS